MGFFMLLFRQDSREETGNTGWREGGSGIGKRPQDGIRTRVVASSVVLYVGADNLSVLPLKRWIFSGHFSSLQCHMMLQNHLNMLIWCSKKSYIISQKQLWYIYIYIYIYTQYIYIAHPSPAPALNIFKALNWKKLFTCVNTNFDTTNK